MSFMEFLEKYVGASEEDRKELMDIGQNRTMTYKDAMNLLYDILEEADRKVEASQGLMEARLKGIYEALPEEVRTSVYNKFKESEDELLD